MYSKLFIVLAVVIVALAEDSTKPPTAEIVSQNKIVRPDGYNFDFKTSDGVSREEEAQLITVGDHQGIGVKGSYSYLGSDGLQYVVNFTADDKGYKPEIRVVPKQ